MKMLFNFLLWLLPALALGATPDTLQSCKALGTATPALVCCPTANLFWGPATVNDLVRVQQASAGNAQKWIPYSQVVAADQVVVRTTGKWAPFSSVKVTPAPTGSVTPPPPPVNTATITLTWKAPLNNTDGTAVTAGEITGYNIYYRTSTTPNGVAPIRLGGVPGDKLTFSTPPMPPATYLLSVTASAGDQESAPSSELVFTVTSQGKKVPGMPTNVQAQ